MKTIVKDTYTCIYMYVRHGKTSVLPWGVRKKNPNYIQYHIKTTWSEYTIIELMAWQQVQNKRSLALSASIGAVAYI